MLLFVQFLVILTFIRIFFSIIKCNLKERKIIFKNETCNKIRDVKLRHNWNRFYPNGWSYAFPEKELKENMFKNFVAFGENLIAFRIKSNVYVLENFCPNMVYDTELFTNTEMPCLKCSKHGWSYNIIDGAFINLGDKTDNTIHPVKIKTWTANLVDNNIYILYKSSDVNMDATPFKAKTGFRNMRNSRLLAKLYYQDITENLSDLNHLIPVHGSIFGRQTFLGRYLDQFIYNEFKTDFKIYPKEYEILFVWKVMLFGKLLTQVDIYWKNNNLHEVKGGFKLLGTDLCVVHHILPLYLNRIKIAVRFFAKPSFKAKLMCCFLPYLYDRLFLQDYIIWTHKCYIERPLLTKSEKKIKDFREWCEQFY